MRAGDIVKWTYGNVHTYARLLSDINEYGNALIRICLKDGTKYPYYEVPDQEWNFIQDETFEVIHGET